MDKTYCKMCIMYDLEGLSVMYDLVRDFGGLPEVKPNQNWFSVTLDFSHSKMNMSINE